MRITTWNVNGLKSSFANNIQDYIKYIDSDIYCLQETKTTLPTVLKHIEELDDYYFFISPCQAKSGYAGVGILSKYKPLNVITKIGFEQFDADGRFLELEFDDFIVINVYMPLGAKDNDHYVYKLESYELLKNHISDLKKPVFLCGDFNIAFDERDLFDPKAFVGITPFRDEERKSLNDLINIGLTDSLRHLSDESGLFTWWSYFQNDRVINKGLRIDYILVSNFISDKLKDFKIHKEIFIADHAPYAIDIEFLTSAEKKGKESGNVFGGLF